MSCLLTSGIAKGCRDNIGGIKEVYLANKERIATIAVGATAMLVDTITTLDALGATAAPAFYTYQVNKVSSVWTDTIAPIASNGGTMYTPSVTMVFGKGEAAKANTVKLMGQSTLVAIVRNNDGKYFLLGGDITANGLGNGLELSAGSYSSGTAFTDLNGYTITLSGGENHPAYEVNASAMTASILV